MIESELVKQPGQFSSQSIRLIPFDIGCRLKKKTFTRIKNYLTKNYSHLNVSARLKAFLSSEAEYFKIAEKHATRLYLCVFDTGIGIFVVIEPSINHETDATYILKFLTDRRYSHALFLNWDHFFSPLMHHIICVLRKVVQSSSRHVRKSASSSWEYKGLSYVFSMSFFHYANEENYLSWDTLPIYLQKTIPILISPSKIFMDDSMLFTREDEINQSNLSFYLENVNEKPIDYDLRNNIMTFMSWAGVYLFGNYTKTDMNDLLFLELELQHYWFYLYCLEQNLPIKNIELDFRINNFDLSQVTKMRFETELIEENIRQINDTSIPERFQYLLKGLIETSGIMELLNRYRKKLDFCKEMLSVKYQSKYKLLSQTSEILLFTLAFIQISPIVYNYMKNHWFLQHDFQSNIIFSIIVVGYLLGSVILIIKNYYIWRG